MSITITGGISFSGGVGIVAPPPTVATAGWFAGGVTPSGNSTNTVDKITYATDTATATVRGTLNNSAYGLAATGTLTDGWFGGGYGGGIMSIVQRITYSTDTATASVRGPLSQTRYKLAATTDTTTYGWYGAGYSALVNRITYASDTITASVRGSLNASVYYLTAIGSTDYGWYAGGSNGSSANASISRIDYANDTATASGRGPLTSATYMFAGAVTDVSTYGWIAGGRTPANPSYISTVTRITYANDTATSTNRGNLTAARFSLAGSSGLQ